MHEKDEEAQEVIDNGKWIKLNRREEKEPELAAKNRSRVAKEMYEKCNPKGFKLLLRYIENPDQFRSEMDEYTVYRIEDMDKKVRYEIRQKYKGELNYLSFIMDLK